MEAGRRSPDAVMARALIQVSNLAVSDGQIRAQLVDLPRRLPSEVEDKVLRMRPFADVADMVRRVNADATCPQQCIGKKFLQYFDFAVGAAAPLPRTRNG